MRQPFSHWLSLALILLLTVQMTGLSCLDDWRDAIFSIHSVNHQPTFSAQADHATTGDDGCPCHLAFVSMPSGTYSVESPASSVDIDLPVSCPCATLSVPFHPPLGS